MVALVRSWRLRTRLYLVWLLTRHPRFRPLYMADVVSYDPLKQAEFLANAGYLPAAVMMARNAVELRAKKVVLLSPAWRAARKAKFCHYMGFLMDQGLIGKPTINKADRFYSTASEMTHGKNVNHNRCMETLREANELQQKLDNVRRSLLRSDQEALAWTRVTPMTAPTAEVLA